MVKNPLFPSQCIVFNTQLQLLGNFSRAESPVPSGIFYFLVTVPCFIITNRTLDFFMLISLRLAYQMGYSELSRGSSVISYPQ